MLQLSPNNYSCSTHTVLWARADITTWAEVSHVGGVKSSTSIELEERIMELILGGLKRWKLVKNRVPSN